MIYPSVYVMIGLGGRSAAKPFLQMAARFSAFFFGGEKVFRIFPTAGSLTGRFVRHFTFCLHFFFQSSKFAVATPTPTQLVSAIKSEKISFVLRVFVLKATEKHQMQHAHASPLCLFDCHVTVCYR